MKIIDLYESNEESVKAILQKECRQVYREFYSNSDRVFVHESSTSGRKDKDEIIFDVLENSGSRKPTDTPLFYHNYMDKVLAEKFGIPFRSSSFFTYPKNPNELSSPRSMYVIFPTDGYTMIAAPDTNDLFNELVYTNTKTPELIEFYQETLTSYVGEEYHKSFTNRYVRELIDNAFNMVFEQSWVKSKEYPNDLQAFKTELIHHLISVLPVDQIKSLPKEMYTSLLIKTVKTHTNFLKEKGEHYKELRSNQDIQKYAMPTKKGNNPSEIMIHCDKAVLISAISLNHFITERKQTFQAFVDDLYNT